jgi:hypothetical protein
MPPASRVDAPAENQQLYGPSGDALIAHETANRILENFRKAYASTSVPRVVIYVNRELVDSTAKETSAASLADRQTVREIERLFGRAFRSAGAQLADLKNATTLLEPGEHLFGDQAAKERAALAKIADIAVEVLVTSHNLTLPGISGDRNYSVPDIQATAIRLKDSAIIGQASAGDVIGRAGHVVRDYDVRDITEATALVLMEDMLTGAN